MTTLAPSPNDAIECASVRPHDGSLFSIGHHDFPSGRVHAVLFHHFEGEGELDYVWKRLGFAGEPDGYQMLRITEAIRQHMDRDGVGIKRQQVLAHVNAIAEHLRALREAIGDATSSYPMAMAVRDAIEPWSIDEDASNRKLPHLLKAVHELADMAESALQSDRLIARAKPARDRVAPLVHELADVFEIVTRRSARANMDKGTHHRDPEYRGPFLRFWNEIVDSMPSDYRPFVDGKTMERILKFRSVMAS